MSTKTFTIKVTTRNSEHVVTDTIDNLIKYFSYTLEVGKSWQHEKGNKKINCNPRTAKSLVTNLNNSKSNSASNGCSSTFYELV